MLMRGSLRGNRNPSPDNPLEQDQAAAVPTSLSLPCPGGVCRDTPAQCEPALPAGTCISVSNVPIDVFSNRFLLGGRVLVPDAFCRENHTENHTYSFTGYGELL